MVKNPDSGFWRGRRVFVTGHTGFKGGWLSLWLHQLEARVSGYSLAPPTDPNLFTAAGISAVMAEDGRGDIRDYRRLEAAIAGARPEVVFHLAAQPLVRASYAEPIETLTSNVIGTANVLECARHAKGVRAVVVITTDKCYDNREWIYPYRECDPLGGRDPYSGSKACAEIVSAFYRDSFCAAKGISVATARAGNVIGGGDWAVDRLVPDCIRAFSKGGSVDLRYPQAVRPWQHVLEPLAGYLMLAERLCSDASSRYVEAWNFGPDAAGSATVGEVAQKIAQLWGDGKVNMPDPSCTPQHEAQTLRLDITKATTCMPWRPRWSLERALEQTISWYDSWNKRRDMHSYTLSQIESYTASHGEVPAL
jgi:CDP-glucose 4,6-dehydratase